MYHSIFCQCLPVEGKSLQSCCSLVYFVLPSSCITRWVPLLLYSLESICSIRRRSRSTPSMFTCILPSSTKTFWREVRVAFPLKFWRSYAVSSLKSRRGWKINIGKTSSLERNTILSHLTGTVKVFWWLTYPFLFNNILFILPNGVQVCYH